MRLRELPWPGNVRELRNVVERAAILTDDVIERERSPGAGRRARSGDPPTAAPRLHVEVGARSPTSSEQLILATLEQLAGDKKRAAEVLGISLKTLYNRLAVYAAAASRG